MGVSNMLFRILLIEIHCFIFCDVTVQSVRQLFLICNKPVYLVQNFSGRMYLITNNHPQNGNLRVWFYRDISRLWQDVMSTFWLLQQIFCWRCSSNGMASFHHMASLRWVIVVRGLSALMGNSDSGFCYFYIKKQGNTGKKLRIQGKCREFYLCQSVATLKM